MMDRSVFSTRVAAGGGAALDTMAATGAELAVFPAPSRATAVKVCDPSGTIVVTATLSMYILAMPICGFRRLIQLTPVPRKLNVARAPASTLSAIEPPLHPPGDAV